MKENWKKKGKGKNRAYNSVVFSRKYGWPFLFSQSSQNVIFLRNSGKRELRTLFQPSRFSVWHLCKLSSLTCAFQCVHIPTNVFPKSSNRQNTARKVDLHPPSLPSTTTSTSPHPSLSGLTPWSLKHHQGTLARNIAYLNCWEERLSVITKDTLFEKN